MTVTTGRPATDPAKETTPGAAARTGVPAGAATSTPRCPAAQRAAGGSNRRSSAAAPPTGQARPAPGVRRKARSPVGARPSCEAGAPTGPRAPTSPGTPSGPGTPTGRTAPIDAAASDRPAPRAPTSDRGGGSIRATVPASISASNSPPRASGGNPGGSLGGNPGGGATFDPGDGRSRSGTRSRPGTRSLAISSDFRNRARHGNGHRRIRRIGGPIGRWFMPARLAPAGAPRAPRRRTCGQPRPVDNRCHPAG